LATAGATVGGSYWGYREFLRYREESDEELRQQQLAAQSAQQRSDVQTGLMLQQLNPFFIAGTIVTTGIGTFIMLRGMRRKRQWREY